MVFYEIELFTVPKIIFSCNVETSKYRNRFEGFENFLEIAICEQGQAIYEYFDGQKETVCPGMLIPIFQTTFCTIKSFNNELQKHTTVGIHAQYTIKKHNSEDVDFSELKSRIDQHFTILIPYHTELDEYYTPTLKILKKIAVLYSENTALSRANAISQWFSLTGLLTDFVIKKLYDGKKLPPAEHIYAQKAIRYIHENYSKPLTIKEIAFEIGVSEGYLHRVFRNVKGSGVSEYINKHRVFAAINLIENKNLSLKEAAFNVGINDPAYMSRLFKKVTGLSCRDYFRNKPVQ